MHANTLNRIVVYCGANIGTDPRFRAAAETLGRTLAEQRIGLVYGGGHVGLMGILADAALAAGGEVIGVIPESLKALELAHAGLSTLHVTADMHSRKAKMLELADAVIALPGGFGTLDELFEALTWSQLHYHQKLCALLNVGGFYDPLLAWVEQAVASGYVKPEHQQLIIAADSVDSVLDELRRRPFPTTRKWVGR